MIRRSVIWEDPVVPRFDVMSFGYVYTPFDTVNTLLLEIPATEYHTHTARDSHYRPVTSTTMPRRLAPDMEQTPLITPRPERRNRRPRDRSVERQEEEESFWSTFFDIALEILSIYSCFEIDHHVDQY
jgi:hypothetical protein